MLKHIFFLRMHALLTDKTDRSCFKRSFPLPYIRFAVVGTFCPVLDFNGNKTRFFLRRSPVKRWIYLDRGVTRLSAVPSIQKSESKIRFSTRSAVFVRNPLKISCLNKFYAFLRWRTAIKSFFCARQSTSAADCYGSPCNNCRRHVLRHK